MALDGAFLSFVRKELSTMIGARVDKIYQPSRDTVVLTMRGYGGAKKILFSASADSARVHFTEQNIDNPAQPPMFCMLLRKHLVGGKLLAIRQDGLERILHFDIESRNELGDLVVLTLHMEIMGKYSNLILTSDNRIIDSIKRVDLDMSSKRLILPGMQYEAPPAQDKLSLLQATLSEICDRISKQGQMLSKALLNTLEGVSPILTREWAYYVFRGAEDSAENMTEEQYDRLRFILIQSKELLEQDSTRYQIVCTKEGNLKDFSFVRIAQYGTLMLTKDFESASETLDYFYAQRDQFSRLHQRANDLFRLLLNTEERIRKRISNQKEELIACAKKTEDKHFGDLISANLYQLKQGDAVAHLMDFYDETCPMIDIPLDVRLSPSQNAQRYYGKYRKAVTAEKKLTEQIASGEEELAYIESVFDALTRAVSESEIDELRAELAEQGYARMNRLKGKAPKSKPPLEFYSSDGYRILVGRNNKQNDKLTLKTAEKLDFWFHTQKLAGSHVIIETGGTTPPNRTLEEAAVLAAYHSKGKDSAQVPVDYCLIKYVKKPAGAKPGMVIFTNYQTAYVTPDALRVEEIRKNAEER